MKIELGNSSPIFIVGAERSGTTLLRLVLTSHSDICIPPESTFFVDQFAKYARRDLLQEAELRTFVNDLYQDEKFTEWKVHREYLTDEILRNAPLSYSSAASTVYRCYLGQKDPGAKVWGDKNPVYIFHLPKIFSSFPNAKVIHIIRHVCGVYNSAKHSAFNRHYGEGLLHVVSRNWAKALATTKRYDAHSNVLSVKYEGLLEDPKSTLMSICAFLGMDFQESMLEFYRKNIEDELVPARRLEWHSLTLQPILQERAKAWQRELNQEEIEYLELVHQSRLRQLEYDTVSKFPRILGVKRLAREYGKYFINRIYRKPFVVRNGTR